jgi:hypothetical protein
VLEHLAVDANLAQWPVGVAQEETGDQGFRVVVGGTPMI